MSGNFPASIDSVENMATNPNVPLFDFEQLSTEPFRPSQDTEVARPSLSDLFQLLDSGDTSEFLHVTQTVSPEAGIPFSTDTNRPPRVDQRLDKPKEAFLENLSTTLKTRRWTVRDTINSLALKIKETREAAIAALDITDILAIRLEQSRRKRFESIGRAIGGMAIIAALAINSPSSSSVSPDTSYSQAGSDAVVRELIPFDTSAPNEVTRLTNPGTTAPKPPETAPQPPATVNLAKIAADQIAANDAAEIAAKAAAEKAKEELARKEAARLEALRLRPSYIYNEAMLSNPALNSNLVSVGMALAEKYDFYISSTNGGGHSYGSKHYSGEAFDVGGANGINGVSFDYGDYTEEGAQFLRDAIDNMPEGTCLQIGVPNNRYLSMVRDYAPNCVSFIDIGSGAHYHIAVAA